MLLGLDPVLSPDLLHALAAMGHGDRIALVDANYPATRGRRLIHLPGIAAPRALQAVLSVLPIDTFIAEPCAVMQVVGEPAALPPVVAGHQSGAPCLLRGGGDRLRDRADRRAPLLWQHPAHQGRRCA